MQQTAPTQPSPTPSSFAGLLATLASPRPAATEDETLWSTSDLGDDVASLSYERALRARARYRAANRCDRLPMPPDDARIDGARIGGVGIDAGFDAGFGALLGAKIDATIGTDTAKAVPALPTDAATDCDLRSASVTIRLSKAEGARLRERAAEAGLTVSAYLRSCALEAEVLRAQVKQALAELKAGSERSREQGNQGPREQGGALPGSKGTMKQASEGVRLTRVFGHIGKLWVGFVSGKSA